MMMMMPGSASACDAPQPKSKQVWEPVSAMRRRLAEHGDPRWPQEQCDSMTRKQLNEHLGELGLKRGQTLTLSMEDYSPDLSWEELQELKSAEEAEKAAAAAAADTPQPKRKRAWEPKEAMQKRLAEHCGPRWTQEQYDNMTMRKMKEHFKKLRLPVCCDGLQSL